MLARYPSGVPKSKNQQKAAWMQLPPTPKPLILCCLFLQTVFQPQTDIIVIAAPSCFALKLRHDQLIVTIETGLEIVSNRDSALVGLYDPNRSLGVPIGRILFELSNQIRVILALLDKVVRNYESSHYPAP
ncbi:MULTISPECIES: hypothetical protein [unclassified Sphingomonas]|uniref:hypothetical protein n=1 Tax=unclassified Sphingomonas TaxID=196159 RepID=UPI0012E39BC8|nr:MULTISPECIES: hypothetical protein [unclassified Sphingomonas]